MLCFEGFHGLLMVFIQSFILLYKSVLYFLLMLLLQLKQNFVMLLLPLRQFLLKLYLVLQV